MFNDGRFLARGVARGPRRIVLIFSAEPTAFPEVAIVLVSDGDRDLWPGLTPEIRDSRTSHHSAHAQSQVWQIWLVLVSIHCVHTAIQNRECRWAWPGVPIFPAHDKRDPWGRGWCRARDQYRAHDQCRACDHLFAGHSIFVTSESGK